MDPIISWAVAFMVAWAPPGRSRFPEAIETPEEGRARYTEIAEAATKIAYDPATRPVFGGPRGRAQTMALLLSIAYHESGFRRDVDLGLGKLARGSGLDSCLVQIRVGTGRTADGWSHQDLVSDREKCFRAGLAVIRRSFGACRRLDQRDWLSAYTRGRCVKDERYSRSRMDLSRRAPQAPLEDSAVLAANPQKGERPPAGEPERPPAGEPERPPAGEPERPPAGKSERAPAGKPGHPPAAGSERPPAGEPQRPPAGEPGGSPAPQ